MLDHIIDGIDFDQLTGYDEMLAQDIKRKGSAERLAAKIRKANVSSKTVWDRMNRTRRGRQWTLEEALTTPVKKRRDKISLAEKREANAARSRLYRQRKKNAKISGAEIKAQQAFYNEQ